MIKYIKYKNIDTDAWDVCIKKSINKDVTALSGYLDIACKKWDALVLGNYDVVMPLPRLNNRLFNNYYTNFLVPQLGIYGDKLNNKILSEFLTAYENKTHKSDYTLNKYNFSIYDGNKFNKKQAFEFDVYTKNNIELNLNYHIEKNISNNEIINFIEKNTIISNINNSDFNINLFRQTLAYTKRNGIAYTYAVYNKHNNIVGFSFFVKSFSKDKLLYSVVKEKSIINEVFNFMLNNHIKNCRHNIGIDLGYSNTYFKNIFDSFNAKQYNIFSI